MISFSKYLTLFLPQIYVGEEQQHFLKIRKPLAVIVAEIPELEKPIFPGQKERPKKLLFGHWKNSFFNVPIAIGMKRIARNGS